MAAIRGYVVVAVVGMMSPLVACGNLANPFVGKTFYIPPQNVRNYDSSIATAEGELRSNLETMQKVPSAYWIDTKDKIRGAGTRTLEGILKDAASKSTPELVTVIWYDLPNRDCNAKASNGEICCYYNADGTCNYAKGGDCAEGLGEYKSEYADPFVDVLEEYANKVPIVVVMEPDSLPNLATNFGQGGCNSATEAAYTQGIKYAMEQLTSRVPSVAVYLDAAHGGWLGWENNMKKFISLLKDTQMPMNKIRGFATNVAGYQPLGVQCPWCPDMGTRNGFCLNGKHADHPCCHDPCGLLGQYNQGNNEMNYAAALVATAKAMGLMRDAHVVIDTGRNGVDNMRQDCASWCNPRNAGAGVPATAQVSNSSIIDAYFWLKTPGESDGCSQTLPSGGKCPRFDADCGGIDSLGAGAGEPLAPEAGQWYDYQVKQLAKNARFSEPEPSSGECDGSWQPAPTPSPWNPSPSPSPSPTPVGGECAGAWQQCGGKTWTGATCCAQGLKCNAQGEYYAQCVPGSASMVEIKPRRYGGAFLK
jgi:cellulose 1,4-beta-cellobiosidase